MLKEATVHFLLLHESPCLNICTLNWVIKLFNYNSIELLKFNWLCKHIEKFRSIVHFVLTNCIELSFSQTRIVKYMCIIYAYFLIITLPIQNSEKACSWTYLLEKNQVQQSVKCIILSMSLMYVHNLWGPGS